jgi:phage portal protein BeeE
MPIGQLDQAYVNATIMPDLDMWEQKFNQVFDLDLEKQPLTADFDERRLLRADEATRINNQRLKIMSGISTQNECRAENGDPPMDGGNELLRPVNLAASGSDMTGTAPDGAGRPAGGQAPDPGAPNDNPQD